MITLRPEYKKVKEVLVPEMFTAYIECNDVEHMEVVVKSAYLYGMTSTKLNFLKIKEMIFAVKDGEILINFMFTEIGKERYQAHNIKSEYYDELERLIVS